jgi:hypothetical protein
MQDTRLCIVRAMLSHSDSDPLQRMRLTASTNVAGRPVSRAVHLAKRVNHEVDLVGRIAQFPEVQMIERPPQVVQPHTHEAAVSVDTVHAERNGRWGFSPLPVVHKRRRR